MKAINKTLTLRYRTAPVTRSLVNSLITGFLLFNGLIANGQVGVNTDTPDNSSALEIQSTTRGLLIPRVTLTSDLTDPSPVTSPAVGLLVFNSGANQPTGFYYWDGVFWVNLAGGGSSGGDYWSLYGNSGTTVGSNFLGTTDNQALTIYTNNTERMRFGEGGQTMIGLTSPYSANDLLTVNGNTSQLNAIGVYASGTGTNGIGVYAQCSGYGFQSSGGIRGLSAIVNGPTNFGVYAKNQNASGYGIITAGSNQNTVIISGRSAGISSAGNEGAVAQALSASGWGVISSGSNYAPNTLSGRSGGIAATGSDGVYGWGRSATGRGVIAGGNGTMIFNMSLECEGGSFTGTHGVFASGASASGTGVIGLGSNITTYSLIASGVGGWFAGNMGLYGKGTAAEGIGVVGVGNNGSTYYTVTGGSGGSFTGNHGLISVGVNATNGTGVVGAGNNGGYSVYASGSGGAFTGAYAGVVGYGTDATSGTGVIGTGNSIAPVTLATGSGGSFIGNTGVYSIGGIATGTGIVGVGNNLAAGGTFANGSGGAFTGSSAGSVSWGTIVASGIGVIGAGNNATPVVPATGGGGAFTGTGVGVYGYAKTAANGVGVIGAGNNLSTPTIPASGAGASFIGQVGGVAGYTTTTGNTTTWGGYFQTGGATSYAYVGYRNGAPWTNYKISGNGSVATIVKNRQGERIALVCPEAPETVFQDFGIGQLVDGRAHITIDPDLAININVSEEHPLKVYITPEGDCNGMYVTNKSVNGFDVVELMGGKSNVAFSWQIVATRADEQVTTKDGSVETTVYSLRFASAPGPLESVDLKDIGFQTTNNQNTDVSGATNQISTERSSVTLENRTIQSVQSVDSEVITVKDDQK